MSVELFSMDGRLVKSEEITKEEMDIKDLVRGLYFIRMRHEQVTYTGKLLID